jgi:cytochrome c-type biogenesis protein CcmH
MSRSRPTAPAGEPAEAEVEVDEAADAAAVDDAPSAGPPAEVPEGRAEAAAPRSSAGDIGSAPPRPAAPRSSAGRGSLRLAGWVAMAILLLGALFVGVADDGGPKTTGERTRDLSSSVACPTCDGQSVADSDSSAARNVRSFIEGRIADGVDDDQIRDELAARYGDEILLTPGRSGVIGLVWVLPVAALVAALAGVALAFRRWRGAGVVHATDADRELVDKARGASGGERS